MSEISSETRELLVQSGAIIKDGHFVFPSGRHGSTFVDVDRLLTYPAHTYKVGDSLALAIAEHNFRPDLLVGSGINGATLVSAVGQVLVSMGRTQLRTFSADIDEFGVRIRPPFVGLCRGKQVVVVEDILTTGNSSRSLVDVLKMAKATVLGVYALINRGQVVAEDIGVPHLHSFVDLRLKSWPAERCPHCRRGEPVDRKVGDGHTWAHTSA